MMRRPNNTDKFFDIMARPHFGPPLAVLAFAIALLLWIMALVSRSAPYTPDEPREFDLAFNMLSQADKAVPLLAGEPFCEKPPLTYWVAAASMKLFGATIEVARAPNLLWMTITVVCLLAWLRSVVPVERRERATVFTILITASMLLLFRVQIWFATDAALVAATAVALLGAWRGFIATHSRARLLGYFLFHLGLVGAFFAKNLLGWLVPLGALGGMILWERRWRELLRYELYIGLVLEILLMGSWVLAVAHHDEGARLLRIFFIDNTLGRLLPMVTEDEYQLGHSNHFGKYLLELPYYLIPWTFSVIAAIRWAYLRLRDVGGAYKSAVRFAIVSIVPGLAFLSFSHTARDVYAAPELLGFVMLLGLWFGVGANLGDRFDRICIRFTVGLAILVGVVLTGVAIAIPLLQGIVLFDFVWIVAPIVIAFMISLAIKTQRQWPDLGALTRGLCVYASGVVVVCAVLFPSLNRTQDLGPAVEGAAREFRQNQLATLREDETIRAYLDFAGHIAAPNLRTLDDAVAWLEADRRRVLLVELYTDHLTENARARLASWHAAWGKIAPRDINASAAQLQARGLSVVWQYSVLGGRTYGVLAKR